MEKIVSYELGIDVGATGIKGGLVDLKKGKLTSDKIKYKTPTPSTPDEVAKVIGQLISDFNWQGKPFSCGFPSVIKNDIICTAANIDDSWKGLNLKQYFQDNFKVDVTCLNDADAAGIAEMKYGLGDESKGKTVLFLTLGTGIGSALFLNKKLVPNTEFGWLPYKDSIAEHYAGNRARLNKELSWEEWGTELGQVLKTLDLLVSPSIIVLGGGVSKHFDQFEGYIKNQLSTPVRPASLLNNAGIVGSCVYRKKKLKKMPLTS